MIKLIQNSDQILKLRLAGHKLREVFNDIEKKIKINITLAELDLEIEKKILEIGAENVLKGYKPSFSQTKYLSSSCLSVNDTIVHGIPDNNYYKLKSGDILTVDIVLRYKDFFVDAAITYPIGEVSAANQKLLDVTKGALNLVCKNFSHFKSIGDISKTIEKHALENNFFIIKELGGHGVGFKIHSDPFVPNYFSRKHNEKLIPGMIISVEPIIAVGGDDIYTSSDGYSIKSKNGLNSAHFEHTLLVTSSGCEIIV